jgi:hypothetical protein
MYPEATPEEQEKLQAFSEAIEVVRTRLQAKPIPRLGKLSHLMNQVDTWSWEEILMRHDGPVFSYLNQQGHQAIKVLSLVLHRCALSNRDGITLLRRCYGTMEVMKSFGPGIALEGAEASRRAMNIKSAGPGAAERRAVGDVTREKVRKLAEVKKYEMSRLRAAKEIAKIIGKEPGHVSVVLRELYPERKSWPYVRPIKSKVLG